MALALEGGTALSLYWEVRHSGSLSCWCTDCHTLSSVAPVVTAQLSPPGPVVEGSTVNLVCVATAGDTPISYSWTGPSGQDVSAADTDGNVSATISASGGYGNYMCTATNDFGMASTTLEVIRAGMFSSFPVA
jgi:hypothetical protein